MTVRWDSWIADETGAVDYARVRSLVAVLLALAAGVVLVGGSALEIVWKVEIPHNLALLSSGVLIVPLTGGHIADAFAGRRAPPPDGAP